MDLRSQIQKRRLDKPVGLVMDKQYFRDLSFPFLVESVYLEYYKAFFCLDTSGNIIFTSGNVVLGEHYLFCTSNKSYVVLWLLRMNDVFT